MHALLAARRARRRLLHCGLSAAALLLAGACGVLGPAPARAAAAAAAPAAGTAREIVVVGDSLSAEYGLDRGAGWVALLGQRLAAEKTGWTVFNASISGDTTAGGLARLAPLLRRRPGIVVIELGGNDALRGLPLADSRRNLDAMATQAAAAGARIVIVGMQVPPNYGRQYGEEFAQMFAGVAAAHKAALVPFLLKGVADRPDEADWFQPDHIHPLPKAHPLMLDNVWAVLEPLVKP
jgi:acyl-CoA thioesterase-1